MNPNLICSVALCGCSALAAEVKFPQFRAVEIDAHIEIGYGVTVADVDGDGKPDILLADKKQIVWYRNPNWEKHVMAENLTPLDNVCIAARDIDGAGKAEVAVGAQWNPGDTFNSGAVFYLIPPGDRTQKWQPVELPHEPTVHRMRWMRTGSQAYELVVAPLHGRGNKSGQGEGVKILSYHKPSDPHEAWKTELINGALHMTHNFELFTPPGETHEGMYVASKEGVFELMHESSGWSSHEVAGGEPGDTNFTGAGEVRLGRLGDGRAFLAAVEPMHGNQLVVYYQPKSPQDSGLWKRQLLDDSLKEGHALACGDLLGTGSDQIVVGWRAKNEQGKIGIKLFARSPQDPEQWAQSLIDDNAMACEDLCLADLNGDGKLDVIASGRSTKNVKIYFNERP